MMPERANRTFICSVLFLDIAEYSKKAVSEQIQLKDRFNALIAESKADGRYAWRDRNRVNIRSYFDRITSHR